MSAHAPVNILLVDDQPAKLMSYEVILAELGENLIKANSAREALAFLLKTDVAVVLADVCMPDLDGFELAHMLREHPRFEKTAIIFVSAIHLSDVDRIRGYETGGVDYVPVPVIPEILRAKVRIFTELYRKTRQLESVNDELERRVRDRTAELEESSARLRLSEERLRLASEAAGFGTYDYNGAAGRFYWSPHLRSMVGMQQDTELTLDAALGYVHADHRDAVRRHMLGDSAEGSPHEIEFKIVRADGEVRWLLDRGQAVPWNGGARVMGTLLDITERKLAEERQRLLMAELDHRVKNILSNVGAIAHLSSHRATSVSAFMEALDGRIRAMSRAHTLLRRGTWDRANLADLATEALSPFRSRVGTNIVISGAPVWIVPELTQSLALILHELATNAVKHGALSSESGRVRVSWSQVDDPRRQLKLVWEEQGGPVVSEPTTKGFGLTVLQAAAGDLGGICACDFRAEGLVYTLQGPFTMQQHAPGTVPYPGNGEVPAEDEPAAEGVKGRSRRILVVEDEALVALQLQEDLESEGHYVVGPARNLAQGISLAISEDIDAALVDVSLGRETSAPIADQLLARNIPFAFATGYADSSILPERLRTVPRLSKPYALKEVRRLIENLVSSQT
jgi:PAS domain S-box-containing protein